MAVIQMLADLQIDAKDLCYKLDSYKLDRHLRGEQFSARYIICVGDSYETDFYPCMVHEKRTDMREKSQGWRVGRFKL